jgi:hypothetical protein
MPRPSKWSNMEGRPNSVFQMIECDTEVRIIPFDSEYEETYSRDDRAIMVVKLAKLGDIVDDEKLTDSRDVEDHNKKRLLYANAQLSKIRNANGKRCEIRNEFVEITALDDNVVISKTDKSSTIKPVSMMGVSEIERELEKMKWRENELYERLYALKKKVYVSASSININVKHERYMKNTWSAFGKLASDSKIKDILEECNLGTEDETLEPLHKLVENVRKLFELPENADRVYMGAYKFRNDDIEFEMIQNYEIAIDERESDDDNNPIGTLETNPKVISILKTQYLSYD